MPNLGPQHSLIVQVVLVCLFAGLPVYWLGFLRRPAFLRPLATLLLVAGTVALAAAVQSGSQAREGEGGSPGPLMSEHRDLGEGARNVFLAVLLLELAGVALAWRAGPAGASVLEVESGTVDAVGASTKRFAATSLRVIVGAAWTLGAVHLYDVWVHGGEAASEPPGPVVEAPAPEGHGTEAGPGH